MNDMRYLIYRYRYAGSVDEEKEFVGVCDTKEIAEKYISKYTDPEGCSLEIRSVNYIEDFDINSVAVLTTITTNDGEKVYSKETTTIQNKDNVLGLPDIKFGDARNVPLVIVQEDCDVTENERLLRIQVISNRKLSWTEMTEVVKKYKDKVYELLPIYNRKFEIGDEVSYQGTIHYIVNPNIRHNHNYILLYQPEIHSIVNAGVKWVIPTGKHSELFEKLFKNEIDLGIITKEEKDG